MVGQICKLQFCSLLQYCKLWIYRASKKLKKGELAKSGSLKVSKIENEIYGTADYFSPTNPCVYTEIVRRVVAPCSVQISQTCWHQSLPACAFPFLHGWVAAPMKLPVKTPRWVSVCPRRPGPGGEERAAPLHCKAQRVSHCLHFTCHPKQVWWGLLWVEPVQYHELKLHSGTEASYKKLNGVRCLYFSVYKYFCIFSTS